MAFDFQYCRETLGTYVSFYDVTNIVMVAMKRPSPPVHNGDKMQWDAVAHRVLGALNGLPIYLQAKQGLGSPILKCGNKPLPHLVKPYPASSVSLQLTNCYF